MGYGLIIVYFGQRSHLQWSGTTSRLQNKNFFFIAETQSQMLHMKSQSFNHYTETIP